ncbi:hypothetical protein J4E89_004636 [Alternaria sp. Ai002NY15]|nr:hypothetical protein J4E89_004636 [Alternaria sp. Ai002NY15]
MAYPGAESHALAQDLGIEDLDARNEQAGEIGNTLAITLLHGHEGIVIHDIGPGIPRIAMLVTEIVRLRQRHLILMLRVMRNCGAWRKAFAMWAR